MDRQYLWMRLGVNIIGTEEELARVAKGDYRTLEGLLKAKSFEIVGDSYAPIADREVNFDINLIQM